MLPLSTSSGSACSPSPRAVRASLNPEPGVRSTSKLDLPCDLRAAAILYHERNTRMSTGTVKWFNATKGYGFITPEDGSKDVFLHISDLQRSGLQDVREGDKVEFDLQRGQQGKVSATNLKMA
jgi:CspA family cold shock protein